MKTLHKTYRFAAALILMVFVSNVMVPTAVSAISLYCDMEMVNSSHDLTCCVHTGDHQRVTMVSDESCPMLSFCEETVSEQNSDQPAITQVTKIVIAADLTDELTFSETDNNHPKKLSDDSESVDFSPPIFLLNSTFLN